MSDTNETVSVIGKVRDKTVVLRMTLPKQPEHWFRPQKFFGVVEQTHYCGALRSLNDLGIKRLRKSNIDELITTDTVPRLNRRGETHHLFGGGFIG